QTIIMTRAQGRVAMPPKEQLQDLAAHNCTLVIFLGITRMTRIVRDLRAAGYPQDTAVAVVYRVGWPDERVIRGDLTDIAAKVREAKITRQALVLVGKAVDPAVRDPEVVEAEAMASSHLYSDTYTHLFRRASNRSKSGATRARNNGTQ
ncbi:MAG: SAM-dependent methyltransferase, partial [Dehalococcoidia bacterium]